jgi:aldose 1-epimerase
MTVHHDLLDTSKSPSGAQFVIESGEYRAVIGEVGASVRDFRFGGREIFQGLPREEFSKAFHGSVLLPWPNRLDAGRYEFDGEIFQTAVTEPDRNTALHGLSPYARWQLADHSRSGVVLTLALLPTIGYPFFLDSTVSYQLDAAGLRVATTSTNVGDRALPYGIGFHPWLSTGGALLDDCTLTLDAGRRFQADDRLLPVGDEDVAGTPFDFRTPREVGELALDDAFTQVTRRSDGLSWVHLTGVDGRTASIWMDDSCDFWQLCSGDGLPQPLARRSIAAEPMTAAPNAFNTGRGLIRLLPGESYVTTWGAALV